MKDLYPFLQQHSSLTFGLIGVLILLFIVEVIRIKLGARRISPIEATQLINHQNAAIVDLRNLEAFNSGHIVGSVCIPASDLEKQSKKLEKYKNRPIIIVCAQGFETPKASAGLLKNGYNVHILSGGIRAWKDAEMPLVKD